MDGEQMKISAPIRLQLTTRIEKITGMLPATSGGFASNALKNAAETASLMPRPPGVNGKSPVALAICVESVYCKTPIAFSPRLLPMANKQNALIRCIRMEYKTCLPKILCFV